MNKRAGLLASAGLVVLLAACDSAEERAAQHLERGFALQQEGKPGKANLEFRNVIKLQPENIEARFAIATFQKRRNNIRGAVGQYRSILELDENHVPARREMAEIMLIANQLEEAQRHVDVAFGLAPDDLMVRAIKSSVEYKTQQSPESIEMAQGVVAEHAKNVVARLVLIAAAMDQGDLDEALAQADAGVAAVPDDLSLNIIRLGVLEQREDIDGIGEQLQRLVEAFPDADRFRDALARWYIHKKRFDDAEGEYRAIAANNPGDYEKSLDVVRFLNVIHGSARAREELETLAAAEGALVEYELAVASLDIEAGDEAAAIARLDRVIAERGETADGDKARIERAKIHIRNEEFPPTDALLSSVLLRDPKNHDALLLRASRYLNEDRTEEAIDDLRTALDVAPEDVQVVLLLATAFERNGNGELALERLAEAVQLSDFNINITLRYTQALMADGKDGVAESLLRDAISRNGESRDLLVALGQIKLEQQAWREAADIAGQLKIIDPDDPVAERLAAAAYLGQDKEGQGIEILQELASAEDADPASLTSLVRAMLAGGDIDGAEEMLRGRIDRDAEDAQAIVLLASILSTKGDLEEAEVLLKRSIDLSPGNSVAYANLARIYNSQGRNDEVTAILQQGLATNENNIALRLTKAMQLEATGDIDGAL
ncbi:MAG: tetratricopeptide repeat protein, partial [Pseudomonadota bacterium]